MLSSPSVANVAAACSSWVATSLLEKLIEFPLSVHWPPMLWVSVLPDWPAWHWAWIKYDPAGTLRLRIVVGPVSSMMVYRSGFLRTMYTSDDPESPLSPFAP